MVEPDEWRALDVTIGDMGERVSRRALEDPDYPAVITVERTLTYRQLLDAAAELAPTLAAAANDRGEVAVLTPFDEFGPIAVLASAIAGCRLALLDTEESPDRLAIVLALIRYPVVVRLVDRAVTDHLAGVGDLDIHVVEPSATPPQSGPVSARPDVVVTTSGSTSAPKVAVIPMSRWVKADHHWTRDLRRSRINASGVSTYASLAMAIMQMGIGGTNVLFDPRRGSTSDLVAFAEQLQVTSLSLTPTMARTFVAITGGRPIDAPLTYVNLRGERASGADLSAVHRLAPIAVVSHLYASTEASAVSRWFWYPGDPIPEGPLPLGELRDDCEVRLVEPSSGDELDRFADQPGELWVKNDRLFLGYVGASSENVLVEFEGEQWVRTGDLASFASDGMLRIHGRHNRRVKVGGLFVELDEVALDLEAFPEVDSAAVTSFDDQGTTRLVAHLRPAPGRSVKTVEVRAALAGRRPLHTVPALFRVLDGVPPLNQSGKLDHLVLSEWRPSVRTIGHHEQVLHVADPVGSWLQEMVAEFLGSDVLPDQDLVDAGMASLDWVELIERVRVEHDAQLQLGEIFTRPTVEFISSLIRTDRELPPLTPLTAGDGTPVVIWLMNGLAAQEAVPIARSLADRATYLVSPDGFGRRGPPKITLADVADEAAYAIDTLPSTTGVVIVGFSTGCHHALATAGAAEAAGRSVELLVLLDPSSSRTSWTSIRSLRRRRQIEYAAFRARRQLRATEFGDYDLATANLALFRARQRETFRVPSPRYAGTTLVVRSDAHGSRVQLPMLTGDVIERTVDGAHLDVIAKGSEAAAFIEAALSAVHNRH